MAEKTIYYDDVNEGDSIPEFVTKPLQEIQFVMYAGASGDFNPLHSVHAFGEKAGFGGVIGHGMLSMALTGRAVTNWIGNKAIKKFGVNFRTVTKPQDVLTVSGSISKKYTQDGENCIDVNILTLNQKGEKVVTGNATAVLPSK